jgi:hypothetical protein
MGAQGSGGTGVTGSGAPGAYGTGESGNAAQMGGTGSAAQGTGSQGGSSAGATAGARGEQSTCALYSKLAKAGSAEERQNLLDRALPGMSPEMQQQHLAMMQKQCQ